MGGFFDIGLMEIIIILIVALLVVGPDRIPEFARKAGGIVRNIKRVTSDLGSEMKKAMEKLDMLIENCISVYNSENKK